MSGSRAGPCSLHKQAPSPALRALLTRTSCPGAFPIQRPLQGTDKPFLVPKSKLLFSLFPPLHPPEISAKLSGRQKKGGGGKPLDFKAGTIRMEVKRPRFCVQLCCATLTRSPPLSVPHFPKWEMKTLDYKPLKRAPSMASLKKW